ncbi:MAG: DsrE family protein [Rhodocyclaceae bacterium]|nr:DsrE family protein [Rhodocyclaceae bacterium]
MQKILMIVHAPPYGSERVLSALRLATALLGQEDERVDLTMFMMSDGVVVGLPNQPVAEAGGGLQQMIEHLVAQGAAVRLCRTCAVARGLAELPLIPGVAIGTLSELAAAAIEADKVITF